MRTSEPPAASDRPSVLIVDDSLAMRTALVAALEADGRWQVLPPAADGRSAVRQANESTPDVIVLDQQMPLLTGLEAAPLLRARCPDAHIVMWSSDPEAEHLAAAAGIDVFVDKSEPLHVLLDAVARYADVR